MTRRIATLLALAGVLAGCEDPTSPVALEPTEPEEVLIGGTPTTSPGFTFLAPIARTAHLAGELDATLPVSVDICKGTGSCTDKTRVEEFSSDSGQGFDRVHVGWSGESYVLLWLPRQSAVKSGKVHRIHVRVGDVVLGGVDIMVVDNVFKLLTVPRGVLGVMRNLPFPIRFQIEKGTVEAGVVGEQGGVVESAEGGAQLGFPEGALDDETTITIQPLADVEDPDQRVVPGTAYEFGPSGAEFGEDVYLGIQYDPAALPDGVSPELLRVHRLVDGEWEVVPGGGVDQETSTVYTWTRHFSTYAVLPAAFTQVVAGENHACGLDQGGRAWCWGANESGQLGDGTTESQTVAVLVSGSVYVGDRYRCRPRAFGSSCWREGIFQPLEYRSIEAGTGHTCAVARDGQAYCWGANYVGQLGTGNIALTSSPVQAAGGLRFTSISAEHFQTCGVTTTGEVYCWGSGQHGALGSPTTETCNPTAQPCSTTPVRVPLPAPARGVDVGLNFACAVTAGEEAYCWGWNALGQLGGGTTSNSEPPVRVPGGPYRSVSAGAIHACAVDDAGAGHCWGHNYSTGALGDGSNLPQASPVPVAGGLRFGQIDASNGNYIYTHTCSVTSSGQAYCWGANIDGQLGVAAAPQRCQIGNLPEFDCALAPLAVPGGLRFHRVTTGMGFTCGTSSNGSAFCWGTGEQGQLGIGGRGQVRTPVRVRTL